MKKDLSIEKDTSEKKVLAAEDLENITGGDLKAGPRGYYRCRHKHLTGPRFKKSSTFGWNWYRKCADCGEDHMVELGPWSGDPD